MTKRVADLTGQDLDRAVANAHGMMLYTPDWQPSRNWAQGGEIIERARIKLEPCIFSDEWVAWAKGPVSFFGRTPLEAAMRCYVACRSGGEV
jgi:hypothetical protein